MRPGLVALVAAGGAVGTLARQGLGGALGGGAGWPVATTVENLVGALALGLLLGALGRGAESPRARAVRLAVGTGVLGGFTTFSTLAIEVQRLGADGHVLLGAAYGLVSVAAGWAVALVGVVAGGRARRGAPDEDRVPDPPRAAVEGRGRT
ncbi:CrcB family protein [Cellulomonas shaoxiangyii]|uniref:Fluoride-specific ion channel FluC n=1 Tax=Cellulomonas shaoxiangyii TaxID=2566013 RepID=A0A4P7SN43_9CELL|nr:CrcB family protein [Cellulomonas shaoxiangyii]TGY85086.1 CrcB family protein [Cellulomonas shaoxiangyii]